jgi:uncharacterized protein (DUF2062 family)
MMIMKSVEFIQRKAANWLLQGISPRRLALTIALGFAIGCIPMVGVTTALCIAASFALRLNFPVIQAANYAVMPLQLALMVPFVRLGGRLLGFTSSRAIASRALLHGSPTAFFLQMSSLAGQALLAWLLIAIPAVALMTVLLTKAFRHVPAVAAAEACD